MRLSGNSPAFGKKTTQYIEGLTFITPYPYPKVDKKALADKMLALASEQRQFLENRGERTQIRFIPMGRKLFGIAVISEKARANVEELLQKIKSKRRRPETALYKNANRQFTVTI